MPASDHPGDVVVVPDEQDEQIAPLHARLEPDVSEPIGDDQIADELTADEPAPTQADDAWPAVQALFIDDPRLAVERAAELTGDALGALVVAARNREQLLRAGWESGETGTEELRTALRGYRALSARVADLAREF